jgi:hypothetical protein
MGVYQIMNPAAARWSGTRNAGNVPWRTAYGYRE